MEKKTTKGRQKIELKKIENAEALHVAFSKRRVGVFKKFSELATMCNATAFVLIFSPSGHPYTFGEPDVETVMNRFLSGARGHPPPPLLQTRHRDLMHQLNQGCTEMEVKLEAARANHAILEEKVRNVLGNERRWWATDLTGYTLEQLELIATSLADLKLKTDTRIAEILYGKGASSSLTANPFATPSVGGPSSTPVNPVATVNPLAMLSVGGPSYSLDPLAVNPVSAVNPLANEAPEYNLPYGGTMGFNPRFN